jgi:heme A synthase
VALGAGAGALSVRELKPEASTRRLALSLVGLFGIQLAAGLANVILLAPIWLQQLHLFLADLVWVALVLMGASALTPKPGRTG